jgi:4'-phosphopantetheinyl transferase
MPVQAATACLPPGQLDVHTGALWQRPYSHPDLDAGAIHVWIADLDTAADRRLLGLLSADERARAAQMLSASVGRRWSCSRALLRVLLGAYLETDPRALRLRTDARGRPLIGVTRVGASGVAESGAGEQRSARGRPSFSVSHSGSVALYAFVPRGSVGVDVELARPRRHTLALAARAFGGRESSRLETLDPEARDREFLRMWARLEAMLKCGGGGIGADLLNQIRDPWVAELDVGTGAAAALAAEHRPRELRRLLWSD